MGEIGAGHVIASKYRLVEPLAAGGMGSVWRAEHLDLRSEIAIKLIIPQYAEDRLMAARFVREARAAAALRSPHVVQILDYGVEDGLAYMAMELLEGESLADRLRREPRVSPELTATIVTHVCRAMAKAHEAGLVHRDLKPGNVFLVQNDDEVIVKVLDFGVAKVERSERDSLAPRTETGTVVGSPGYMSPEQARGRSDVDHRSDLWSIAVVAFRCLVGRLPFDGNSLGEVILSICSDPIPVPSRLAPVPEGFDEWFARATQRDVAHRFQSARELASALREVVSPGQSHDDSDAFAPTIAEAVPDVAGSQPQADEVDTEEPSVPAAPSGDVAPLARRRGLWAAGLVGVALLLALAAWLRDVGSTPEPAASPMAGAPAAPPAAEVAPAAIPVEDAGVAVQATLPGPTSAIEAPAPSAVDGPAKTPARPRKRRRPKLEPKSTRSVAAPPDEDLLDRRF